MENRKIILCIDSTSYIPRVALVENDIPLLEITQTKNPISWDSFRESDGTYIRQEFEYQLDILLQETKVSWQDIDMICYSGFSGFEKIMEQGKNLASCLGKKYGKKVIAVDHICAHDISSLIEQEEVGKKYPILVFSASGSHNSFSVFQNKSTHCILGNETEFDREQQKYIGLGSIFFHLIKSLGLFDSPSGTNNIADIIRSLPYKVSQELVDFVISHYESSDVYSLHIYEIFCSYRDTFIINNSNSYSVEELYFSFEKAIIDICMQKFLQISSEINFQELHIVGGIACNDNFFQAVKDFFSSHEIHVYRPGEKYRLDNASMLGVLAYFQQQLGYKFEFSHIVTQ